MHAASYPWTMNLISVPSSVLIIYAVIAIPILYSNFRAHRIVSCRLRANSFEELYPLMSFLWYFGFHTQCTVHRMLSFLSFFRFQSGASSLVLRSNSPVHDTWFGLSCPYRRHSTIRSKNCHYWCHCPTVYINSLAGCPFFLFFFFEKPPNSCLCHNIPLVAKWILASLTWVTPF